MRKRQNCMRVIEFDAAHRLPNHPGKCRSLHGHRYRVEITCSAAQLDHVGVVLDFGEIKHRIGGWIDEHWDHGSILCADDWRLIAHLKHDPNQKVFVVPFQPSAENLATYLLRKSRELLTDIEHVDVVKVRLWETPNCWAEAV